MTTAGIPILATTTHRARSGTPRHRADPSAIRATKAAMRRSYRLTIAARRRDRDILTIVATDTTETEGGAS